MQKQTVVREAVLEDCSSLTELAWQLGHQAKGEQIKTRLLDLLRRDGHKVLVAEVGGKVAGWVHAFINRPLHKDTTVEIAGLVIDQSYRRMGIGRKLLDAVEEWAKNQGCDQVTLASNITREGAHQFYQAVGYQRTKTQYIFRKELPK
ncbi:GNAT family N-acetyltransferase [Capillibacterium thermochitinicola]|uniref:GNAT family N-acetyltransferase n=1 Tax=Capillibacterium thermochitinicola TaxID=2699427 RepID=A0A8J6I006_9FIRM|nr:GNAT family N-acetyltransferase [Capillibacterium thermochitinicola]MBA2132748.1 GNAT family N-acetyltransferase [Capillibacterium thermochitinicola]